MAIDKKSMDKGLQSRGVRAVTIQVGSVISQWIPFAPAM
jgi:hypothetical protein